MIMEIERTHPVTLVPNLQTDQFCVSSTLCHYPHFFKIIHPV